MTGNIMSLTVFFQIPLNRRMVQKRRQVVIKGKFREHHNFLRQIGSLKQIRDFIVHKVA